MTLGQKVAVVDTEALADHVAPGVRAELSITITTTTRLTSATSARMRVRRSPHDATSPCTEPTRVSATRDSSLSSFVGHLQPRRASSHQHTSQRLLCSLCLAGTLQGLRLPNPHPPNTHPLLTIPPWRARSTRAKACPGPLMGEHKGAFRGRRHRLEYARACNEQSHWV